MVEREKSLNDKIAELDKKIEWFHSDDFKLEDAMAKYKEAAKLAKDIEKDLEGIKNEIEVLSEDFSK
jgi:exodeoxyribonuclease VII small subunit